MTTDSLSLRETAARLTHALAVCRDEQAAAVRTILHQGAGLLGLPEGAALRHPAGLVPDRREAWGTLIDALRLDAVGVARDWDDAARDADTGRRLGERAGVPARRGRLGRDRAHRPRAARRGRD